MINLTFASFKQNRDNNAVKMQIAKKHDLPTSSFKAVCELKDKNIQAKRLDNQENTLTNAQSTQGTHLPRKNMVKVDKSNKKYQKGCYKSPHHKNWEQLNLSHALAKPMQQSNYCLKYSTTRNEVPSTVMTPSLNKNNRSITADEEFNASFLTQKHSVNKSEQDSVSSNKNSFNDSYQFYAQNLSIQEEFSLKDNLEVVNSLELQRDPAHVPAFPLENELKTMKKSTQFFYNNQEDSVLKDLETESNRSVANSINSMKFSQKFKHYKKRQPIKSISSGFSLRDFKLLDEIGSGKYGKVYLAKHVRTGFICALKEVPKKIIKEEKLEIPFIREIKIQLYLNHPNIIQLYGLFHDSENVYLIMEYCSGNHLLKQIKQRNQFTENEILRTLHNIYEAVSYIHCNGVIHRDIKPENIVIEHGVYKLCDFGWAAYTCGHTRTTFCGTPLYVCPEVLKGEQYNEKADIWGLGIVTYELTFGRVPFPILNQSDLRKIISDPVYFPVWGQVSEKLVSVVRRMLDKDSKERPSLNEILASELFDHFTDSPDPALKQELDTLF